MSQNPLLNLDGLIDFAAIRPEHVAPAIRELIAEAQKTLDAVTKPEVPADFDSVAETLTTATLRLSRAWGAVSHLMSVNDSEALRSVFNEMLPEVTQFWIGLSQNESLYGKYKAMHDAAGFESLTPVRQKIINDELRDFRLSGAELPESERQEVKAISERLSALSQKFSENLLDATNAWTLDLADDSRLKGGTSARCHSRRKDGCRERQAVLHRGRFRRDTVGACSPCHSRCWRRHSVAARHPQALSRSG